MENMKNWIYRANMDSYQHKDGTFISSVSLNGSLNDGIFLKKITLLGDEAREEALDILKKDIEEKRKK